MRWNIEKVAAFACYSIQDVHRVLLNPLLSVVTLFHFLESLSRNRKSDVLFTRLSAWEASDCIFFCCWVGWRPVWWYVALTFWLSRILFCFILFWLYIYADLFTPSVHSARVEVLTHQLLCLAAVWVSGLFFLPLFDYSLIMVRSFYSVVLSLFIYASLISLDYFPYCTVLLSALWQTVTVIEWLHMRFCDCKRSSFQPVWW